MFSNKITNQSEIKKTKSDNSQNKVILNKSKTYNKKSPIYNNNLNLIVNKFKTHKLAMIKKNLA